jgi:hypothetical protein
MANKHTIDFDHVMVTGDVARVLGLGTARVRQMDEVLKPIVLANGERRYDPKTVKQVLKQRAA